MKTSYVVELGYKLQCSDLRAYTLNQDPLPLPKTDSQELVKEIIKHSSWPQSIYSLMREMDKWIQCIGK